MRAAGADAGYDTRYSYDPNGNLLTQTRRDGLNALADDLKYTYIEGTNQLLSANLPAAANNGSEKVYSSGPVVPDGQPYSQITLQGPAYVASNAQVTLKPTHKGIIRSGFVIQSGGSLTLEIGQPAPLASNYVYDKIGNLTEDKGEGTLIEWNVYGKVRKVTSKATGTVVTYRYDAMGNRVEKLLTQGGATTTTRYVRDASGNVMATYQGEQLLEQPLYGSSRLGLYKGGRLAGQRRLGNKQYELNNHLGNVLAVVSDNIYLDGSSTWGKTLATNDYYPFGLQMPGRSYNSDSYRYGFNGKEKDGDFGNNYDYGFRIYNPRISKFLSVDPLAKGYPWYTPYQFAGNKPINAIDLDGLEEADVQRLPLPNGQHMIINVADENEVLIYEQRVHEIERQLAAKKKSESQLSTRSYSKSPNAEEAIKQYWDSYWNRLIDASGKIVSHLPIAGSLTEYQEAKLNNAIGTGSNTQVAMAFMWFAVDLATLETGGFRKAAAEETVSLYRYVGQEELADIFESKLIRPGGGSMETKLFAETFDDALGQAIADGKDLFFIIKVEVKKSFVDAMYKSKDIDTHIAKGRFTYGLDPGLVNDFKKNIVNFFTTPALQNTAEGVKTVK